MLREDERKQPSTVQSDQDNRRLRPFPIGKILGLSIHVWLVGIVFPGLIVSALVWILTSGKPPGKIIVRMSPPPEPVTMKYYPGSAATDSIADELYVDSEIGFSIRLPKGNDWVVRKGTTPEVVVKAMHGDPGGRAIFVYSLPQPFEQRDLWSLELSDLDRFLAFPGSISNVSGKTIAFRKILIDGHHARP